MTDLEMTRLCAEAMGIPCKVSFDKRSNADYIEINTGRDPGNEGEYDPLHDDAQAMALVRWLVRYNDNEQLEISNHVVFYQHRDLTYTQFGDFSGSDGHLNRAIVECVAKMQSAATESTARGKGQ
jgi:hypothetical protein